MRTMMYMAVFAVCLAVVPRLAKAGPCEKNKVYAAECKALYVAAQKNMCEPDRLYTNSVSNANAWQQAVKNAQALEDSFVAFAAKYPTCIDDKFAKKCRITKYHLRDCKDLVKKYEKSWLDKIKYAHKEVARFLPGFEKKVKESPKDSYKYFRQAQKYLSKVLGSVLWVDPTNKDFLAYGARIRVLKKKMNAANMDELAKIRCPKAGAKNKKLSRKLMKTYKKWLGGLSYKVKPHSLRMAKRVIKETDFRGTKWEYGYVTTCIEDLSDKKDPARCAVNELSFKRSKPSGKSWSKWSFNGHGARDDAMLCKNIRK